MNLPPCLNTLNDHVIPNDLVEEYDEIVVGKLNTPLSPGEDEVEEKASAKTFTLSASHQAEINNRLLYRWKDNMLKAAFKSIRAYFKLEIKKLHLSRRKDSKAGELILKIKRVLTAIGVNSNDYSKFP